MSLLLSLPTEVLETVLSHVLLAVPDHHITITQPEDDPEDRYEKDDSWVCSGLSNDIIGTHEHTGDWNGYGDDDTWRGPDGTEEGHDGEDTWIDELYQENM
jgi:hypothetical protein